MKYKILNWLLFLLAIVFTVNIVRIAVSLSRQNDIIREAKDTLQKESEENQNLKRQIVGVESQDFIEREARNKLNLGKEGEIVVLLPSISPVVTPTEVPISPNWQKWMKLFW